MRTLALVSLFVLTVACTGPSSSSTGSSSTEAEMGTGFRVTPEVEAFMQRAVEESEAQKQRAELRELHRRQGKRVCEEGEDGTRWQERCNTCWCDHGVRACTKAKCVDRPREEHLNGLEKRLRARESTETGSER
jgi:hypothetical protein